jgi:hypothetical protein
MQVSLHPYHITTEKDVNPKSVHEWRKKAAKKGIRSGVLRPEAVLSTARGRKRG